MNRNEQLGRVLPALEARNLSRAISEMEIYLSVHPHQMYSDRLFAIRSDFQMMSDYWRSGYKDPRMDDLYDRLLRRIYSLYSNMSLDYAVGHSSFLSTTHLRVHMTARDFSPQVVKDELETFVSDVAMAGLTPENKRKEQLAEIYRQHQMAMDVLFDAVWTSPQWSDGVAQAWTEILLSPTIDSNDQQLLVSAIMISAMNFFDMAKFRLLANVYQRATDEKVRQRALVGWGLALNSAIIEPIYDEAGQIIAEMVTDDDVCKELTELQIQMYYCLDAEDDNRKIQQEIMPTLLKSNGFRITPEGIKEGDDDPMEDILHPDAAEQNMEKVEQSFLKMKAMEQQGSDIYFGGFSQMKRFSFFQTMSNWFVPFYNNHPQIGSVMEQFSKNRFLMGMINKGAFCNSDKYSLTLAFEHIVNKLPQNIMDMFQRGEATVSEVEPEEMLTPAYIRRIYLQDLYRFFRIYNYRSEFSNPFAIDSNGLFVPFITNRILAGTRLEEHYGEILSFLTKRKRHAEAALVIESYKEKHRDYQFYVVAGNLLTFHNEAVRPSSGLRNMTAADCFQKALLLKADDERATAGLARALFYAEDYEQALNLYDSLADRCPEKTFYQTSKAVCLANMKRYDDARQLLFKLNYEKPDDDFVSRLLAWTLVCCSKYEQADSIYTRLLAGDNVQQEDLLRYGYCLWIGGNVNRAVDCFGRYLKESGKDKKTITDSEAELLKEKGISETEMQTMLFVL